MEVSESDNVEGKETDSSSKDSSEPEDNIANDILSDAGNFSRISKIVNCEEDDDDADLEDVEGSVEEAVEASVGEYHGEVDEEDSNEGAERLIPQSKSLNINKNNKGMLNYPAAIIDAAELEHEEGDEVYSQRVDKSR